MPAFFYLAMALDQKSTATCFDGTFVLFLKLCTIRKWQSHGFQVNVSLHSCLHSASARLRSASVQLMLHACSLLLPSWAAFLQPKLPCCMPFTLDLLSYKWMALFRLCYRQNPHPRHLTIMCCLHFDLSRKQCEMPR